MFVPLYFLALTATVQPQPPAGYTYCYASIHTTQYFTAPLQIGIREIRLAFLRHLEQKYDFKGLVRCTQARPREVVEAELRKMMEDAKKTGRDKYIVAGWVPPADAVTPPPAPAPEPPPKPAPAPPAAANPAPAPSPPTTAKSTNPRPAAAPAPVKAAVHAVCWADFDPTPRYYSAVFDGTRGDYADWMPAFKGFLEKKYQYTRQVRCTKQPSLADAKRYLTEMLTTAKGLTLAGGVKPKVIETGWKYGS